MSEREQGFDYGKDTSTFRTPALFFNGEQQVDIADCYGYVCKVDGFVDKVPQDPVGLQAYKEETNRIVTLGESSDDPTMERFRGLMDRRGIDLDTVNSMYDSMALDITKSSYETYEELKTEYYSGVAESIGVMMCRIIGAPEESIPFAKRMARSFQQANVTRDIKEDQDLGRQYIPTSDLKVVGLPELSDEYSQTPEFARLIEMQMDRYYDERRLGIEGLKYLPFRAAIAVAAASESYTSVMRTIEQNPPVVFERRVRPSGVDKGLIIGKALLLAATNR